MSKRDDHIKIYMTAKMQHPDAWIAWVEWGPHARQYFMLFNKLPANAVPVKTTLHKSGRVDTFYFNTGRFTCNLN